MHPLRSTPVCLLVTVLFLLLLVAPVVGTVRIVPIGDSITQGTLQNDDGLSHPTYRYWLWQTLKSSGYDVDFVGSVDQPHLPYSFDQDNEGHDGYRTRDLLGNDRLKAWLTGYSPDIAIVHLGSNDAMDGVPVETTIGNLKQIVTILRAKNPSIVILIGTVIPRGGYGSNLPALNSAIPGIAASMSTPSSPIVIVDQFTGYDGYDDNQPKRYLHPNQQGEQKIAARYAAALAPYLESPGPYTDLSIPGRVEAEAYDKGGEGVAYHDTTTGNQGGAYRQDDVDIESGASGYDLCFIRDGEWVNYTVNVVTAGEYTATFRTAAWNDGHTITLSVDGTPVGSAELANTGSSEAYVDTTMSVSLSAGTHTLTVQFSGDGENLDYLSFAAVPVTTPTSRPTLQPIPPSTLLPTDPDQDGLYEDIDGNGVLDFNDIVLFFDRMDWIAGYEPVEVFDFDRNGRIDFNDIVGVFSLL
jgi:PKD repeat protein